MGLSGHDSRESNPDEAPDDKFEEIMKGFHHLSRNKVDKMWERFEKLKKLAGNVAVFYGEREDLEWDELFELFLNFLHLIVRAKEKNLNLAKKMEKEKKRERRKGSQTAL